MNIFAHAREYKGLYKEQVTLSQTAPTQLGQLERAHIPIIPIL